MTFEEKVKSMKVSEIIQAMIDGLYKEHVKIDMDTYGTSKDGICYGCAATNTICEISVVRPNSYNILKRYALIGEPLTSLYFLEKFENAINCIRIGCITSYNYHASQICIATIPDIFIHMQKILPILKTDTWKHHIHKYQEFADMLKENGY